MATNTVRAMRAASSASITLRANATATARHNLSIHIRTKMHKHYQTKRALLSTAAATQSFPEEPKNDEHEYKLNNNDVEATANPHFPRMFQSLDLGPSIGKLPNRILMGSMHTGLEGHSIPNFLTPFLKPEVNHDNLDAMAAYFEARAKGGAGLMVTGGIAPNREGWVGPFAAKLSTRDEMILHKEVTERVHNVIVPSYDGSLQRQVQVHNQNQIVSEKERGERARICLQILHAGRYAHHPFAVSASPTRSPISMFQARPLSLSQIQTTISDFVNCAVLAKEAGYDGVEIMGSEGYLIHQFIAPRTNHRTGPEDPYSGESLENRMRFAVEIVKETRQAVGDDFILIFRLSMLDLVEQGSSWEEIKIMAQAIEDAGATIINTGIGWHEARIPTIATSVPRGSFAYVTQKMKMENVVDIPLCATNRVNAPKVGENILETEGADLVSMARPFLADPEIVQKSREGRVEEINTCIACNQACLDHAFVGKTASCLVNPMACHETELSVKPNSVPKEDRLNIGVIGSGPAGLAFATTAATIGHNVTLFDKADEIGGQFNMAKRIPGKEEFHETIRYFDWKIKTLETQGKLKVCLGPEFELSHEDMLKMSDGENRSDSGDGKIDKWIVATGVSPRTPSIPGIDHPNVLSYIDVLRNGAKVGESVAIIGAGGIGFDVAEYLIHHEDQEDGHGHNKGPDEVNVSDFLSDWGVDASNETRGGLLQSASPQHYQSGRKITMLQRKKGKLGKNLGKTTGWIHRATLAKSHCVDMQGSVTYNKVDDKGHLHITVDKGSKGERTQVLEVDNIITCAGQVPMDDLRREAVAEGDDEFEKKVYTIGGAYEALELDAKFAIDMGTRLALKISDGNVIPGKHKFASGAGPEEKLFGLLQNIMK